MNKIRVIELFAGYGSQHLALKRLKRDHPDFEYEVVSFCEIDGNAVRAYRALHGDKIPNLGDITGVNPSDVPDCDLMTWSFPCTDISSAGQQKGLAEGSNTRSSLCWDAIHIFEEKRPKYLLMENVSGLVSKRFINDFDNLQSTLSGLGYTNFFKIINSKDMGVPQNRKRLFMVSVLGDGANYSFPAPVPLEKDVTQLLEDSVDERYYLSAERVCDLISKVRDTEEHRLRNVLGWTRDRKGVVVDYHTVDVANCVTANKRDNTCNYVMERHFLNGDKDGNASTLTTSHDFAGNITTPKGGHKQMGVLEIKKFDTNELVRVRKLTEREYFRIMDVDEKDIDALLTSGVPNTQLAKLAGNSIVVNVLYHIFRTMFIDTGKTEGTQTSLF